MLWSLRLKLNLSRLGVVTQWQRTRRREFCHDDDDGAPFFRRPLLRYIHVYGHFFSLGLGSLVSL
jgi:hypothetical protein